MKHCKWELKVECYLRSNFFIETHLNTIRHNLWFQVLQEKDTFDQNSC